MESKSVEGNADQNRWVIQIREGLEYVEKEEKLELSSVSVFNVPKELLALKPEAYIPQAVSIGPYHHCKSELYETERYKVAAARRAQKRLNGDQKFESVVQEFRKLDWRIRSCYHKCLDYEGETLAWLMALDASFVLEYLQFYVHRNACQRFDGDFNKQLSHSFDPKGRSAVNQSILKDIMMLENQVPLFLLRKLLEMQFDSNQDGDEKFCALASRVCAELSPFKFGLPQMSICDIEKRGHILELLYYALVPIPPELVEIVAEENKPAPSVEAEPIKQALSLLWKLFSSLNVGPIRRLLQLVQRVMTAKSVQFMMKLPWRSLSRLGNMPFLRKCKGPLGYIFNFVVPFDKDEVGKARDEAPASSSQGIPPSRDEPDIPSVSELYNAGVKFAPTKGDLASIRFDDKTATLYLPAVRLDTSTEVILRNLIAFEASAGPGTMVFASYIDLMDAMIDTEEDARLLRKSGVIHSRLRNDQAVASLWNSIGRCVRLSKIHYIDKAIADLNKYYQRRWNVVLAEHVDKYIFRSWKCLSLLAAVLLLGFSCLQAFCSVYVCSKGISNSNFIQS